MKYSVVQYSTVQYCYKLVYGWVFLDNNADSVYRQYSTIFSKDLLLAIVDNQSNAAIYCLHTSDSSSSYPQQQQQKHRTSDTMVAIVPTVWRENIARHE